MRNFLGTLFDLRKMMRIVLFVVVPAILFYTLSLIILMHEDYSIIEILRDFPQQMEEPALLGFLSAIGIWMWISAFAIASFSLLTYKERDRRSKELLFLLGLFSLLLAIDDYFLIHDWYVDQKICYATYAFIALAIMLRHFKRIVKIDGFAFLLAGFLLALSIFTDLIQNHLPFKYKYTQVAEEGFKFVGIATWLYFVSRVASLRETE